MKKLGIGLCYRKSARAKEIYFAVDLRKVVTAREGRLVLLGGGSLIRSLKWEFDSSMEAVTKAWGVTAEEFDAFVFKAMRGRINDAIEINAEIVQDRKEVLEMTTAKKICPVTGKKFTPSRGKRYFDTKARARAEWRRKKGLPLADADQPEAGGQTAAPEKPKRSRSKASNSIRRDQIPDDAIQLNTWPAFFQPTLLGKKSFEVRREDDKNFAEGTTLHLREYDEAAKMHTGRELVATVNYKLSGGRFGLEDDACVLALANILEVTWA